jgi:hypothetical protein
MAFALPSMIRVKVSGCTTADALLAGSAVKWV